MHLEGHAGNDLPDFIEAGENEGPGTASSTPIKGMYVLADQLESENVATPIAATNGTTWQ